MTVPRPRLLDLLKVQCQVFAHAYNPDGVRTGNKILRQRLRGAAMLQYYPAKMPTVRDLMKEFKPLRLTTDDEKDLDRLEKLQELRERGKGAPKKKNAPSEKKKGKR